VSCAAAASSAPLRCRTERLRRDPSHPRPQSEYLARPPDGRWVFRRPFGSRAVVALIYLLVEKPTLSSDNWLMVQLVSIGPDWYLFTLNSERFGDSLFLRCAWDELRIRVYVDGKRVRDVAR
jgi:hypothetical protein